VTAGRLSRKHLGQRNGDQGQGGRTAADGKVVVSPPARARAATSTRQGQDELKGDGPRNETIRSEIGQEITSLHVGSLVRAGARPAHNS